jgi:hypothetical protein
MCLIKGAFVGEKNFDMCQCLLNTAILAHGYEQDKAVLPMLHTSLVLVR